MNTKERKIDIVIPVLGSDLDSFLLGYPYIMLNLPCKRIILIGSKEIADRIKGIEKVVFVDENSLIEGMSISEVKAIKKRVSGTERRTGWYFQQFLKMAYTFVCTDEYYLIWDADTIPIKKIDFFDEASHPLLAYRDYVPNDRCYDDTQDAILSDRVLHKSVHRSYIAEHMLVNVGVMKELIGRIEANNETIGKSFYEKIMYCVPKKVINLSGFSEFELYAAFLLKYYPEIYVQRKWHNLRNAKVFISSKPSDIDLRWVANKFDVVSLENFCSYWLICRIITLLDSNRRISFAMVYGMLNPIAEIIGQLQFRLRSVLKK